MSPHSKHDTPAFPTGKSHSNPSRKKRLEGFLKWEAEAPRKEGDQLLGAALAHLIDRLGYGERLNEQRALEVWAGVVGEQIAKVAKPKLIKDGELEVKVSNAAWRQEMIYLSADILKRLNIALGSKLVKSIRFR